MIKGIIKKILPNQIINWVRKHKDPNYETKLQKQNEISRLQKIERFIKGSTNILGKEVIYADSASFLFIYDEMFNKQIYKFESSTENPYIIDAGANIGLSIIYFKQLYPNAQIVAFEPDDKIFKILKSNITSFEFNNITLIQKALWDSETTLSFFSEGADGGRIAVENDKDKIIEIKTIRLKEFLYKKVDLLKIDIEGAEYTVLKDSFDLLSNVENLFVEFHSFATEKQELGNILSILTNAGFRYQVQHIGVFSNHPFLKVNEYNNMDLQLNIFAYKR